MGIKCSQYWCDVSEDPLSLIHELMCVLIYSNLSVVDSDDDMFFNQDDDGSDFYAASDDEDSNGKCQFWIGCWTIPAGN